MSHHSTSSAPTIQDAQTCASLAEYLASSGKHWLSSHPARTVRELPRVADAGDPIECVVPSVPGKPGVVDNDVSCFPWVCTQTMPGAMASRYVAFALKATYAALIARQPSLRAAFSNGAAMLTTAPVVGVRAGMLAAFGPPASEALGPITDVLYYDSKRSKLWVCAAKPDEDSEVTAWRQAMDSLPTPDGICVEIMLAWAHVAPLLACMSSAECYTMGNAYTVPFVQRSISEFFATQMDPRAYDMAQLDKPIVWDSALQAAIQGYPVGRVMAWASDPVMAVCAERRVLTDPATISASRAREVQARQRCAAVGGARPTRTAIPDTARMWASVRAGSEYRTVLDEDERSLATALMVDAPDVGSVAPGDSISVAGRGTFVEPPMASRYAPEVPENMREDFRRMMQGAHAGDARAGSFAGVAGEDESVRF